MPVDCENFRFEPKNKLYKEVTLDEINKKAYESAAQAAHVMIYAPMDSSSLPPDRRMNHCILMQFRFDGSVGFSGGEVDPGETPKEAVVRETEEEMGVTPGTFSIDENDLVAIHYVEEKNLLLHFYSKKITMDEIISMEHSALKCESYGDEVMGLIRVPLYTMDDGFRGFPAFLTNHFVGNAKQQLLHGLVKAGIMTQEEINKALASRPKLLTNNANS